MHPDHDFPEDPSRAEPRRIEQRLRTVRPRPTTLDAHAVLREASRREMAASLSDERAGSRHAPPTPWLALSAAGGCGALAGAALTCLVMLSFLPLRTTAGNAGNGGLPAARPAPPLAGDGEGDHGNVDSRSPAQSDRHAARDLAGGPVGEERLAVPATVKGDSPQASGPAVEWLSSESGSSRPWMELLSPQGPGERLVAGNHLPLQSNRSPAPLDAPPPVAEAEAFVTDPGDAPDTPSTTMTPMTPDPDGLLRELLGTPPGSTL